MQLRAAWSAMPPIFARANKHQRVMTTPANNGRVVKEI